MDACPKWPEVFEMTQTSTSQTIDVLRQLFARYGLPQVVSDNGPQFTSEEFAKFMRANGIKHTRCAPYHPSSNGAIERFVQTFKKAILASEKDGLPLPHNRRQTMINESRLDVGERVMIKNFRPGLNWLPGTITRKMDPYPKSSSEI